MLSAELHVHIHVQFNWLVISASSPRTAHEKWPGNYHFIRYHCYHCDRITYQFHHNFILSSSWWYSFFHLLRWALVITDHCSLSRESRHELYSKNCDTFEGSQIECSEWVKWFFVAIFIATHFSMWQLNMNFDPLRDLASGHRNLFTHKKSKNENFTWAVMLVGHYFRAMWVFPLFCIPSKKMGMQFRYSSDIEVKKRWLQWLG